jgi:hypothetical protein
MLRLIPVVIALVMLTRGYANDQFSLGMIGLFFGQSQAKSSSLNRRLTMLWAAMTHEGFVEGLHCFGFGSYVVPCGFLTALRTAIN